MAFLDISTVKVNSNTFPPVNTTFSGVRGRWECDGSTAVFVSQDSRPVCQKQTSWNAAGQRKTSWNNDSWGRFCRGMPPVRATRDGFMGCWKPRGHQTVNHGPISYVFVRDEQAVVKPSVLVSEKRGATSVIAQVSSCNQLFGYLVIYAILLIVDIGFVSQSATKKSRSFVPPKSNSSDTMTVIEDLVFTGKQIL